MAIEPSTEPPAGAAATDPPALDPSDRADPNPISVPTVGAASVSGPVVDAATPVRAAAGRVRTVLRLNAATSMVGGLAAVVAAGPLDRLLGTDAVAWVRSVGVGLIAFAGAVGALAGASIRRVIALTPWISVADATWVVASGVSIGLGWYTAPGAGLIALVAAAVATFGVLQVVRVLRLRAASRTGVPEAVLAESPPTEVVHASASVEAPPERVWRVITDHELFARLAPNLSGARATAPNGPGLTRTCVNRAGEEWHEACTLWDEGRRFEVVVDTADYPYPLAEMRGSWWLDADGSGGAGPVRVGMDYRFRPRRGLRGRVFAATMQAGFPAVLSRILRGWRAAAGQR